MREVLGAGTVKKKGTNAFKVCCDPIGPWDTMYRDFREFIVADPTMWADVEGKSRPLTYSLIVNNQTDPPVDPSPPLLLLKLLINMPTYWPLVKIRAFKACGLPILYVWRLWKLSGYPSHPSCTCCEDCKNLRSRFSTWTSWGDLVKFSHLHLTSISLETCFKRLLYALDRQS